MIATDAIRNAAAAGPAMTITVVPVVMSTTDKVPDDEQIPNFQSASVVAYQ